jgi:hypothetical protein
MSLPVMRFKKGPETDLDHIKAKLLEEVAAEYISRPLSPPHMSFTLFTESVESYAGQIAVAGARERIELLEDLTPQERATLDITLWAYLMWEKPCSPESIAGYFFRLQGAGEDGDTWYKASEVRGFAASLAEKGWLEFGKDVAFDGRPSLSPSLKALTELGLYPKLIPFSFQESRSDVLLGCSEELRERILPTALNQDLVSYGRITDPSGRIIGTCRTRLATPCAYGHFSLNRASEGGFECKAVHKEASVRLSMSEQETTLVRLPVRDGDIIAQRNDRAGGLWMLAPHELLRFKGIGPAERKVSAQNLPWILNDALAVGESTMLGSISSMRHFHYGFLSDKRGSGIVLFDLSDNAVAEKHVLRGQKFARLLGLYKKGDSPLVELVAAEGNGKIGLVLVEGISQGKRSGALLSYGAEGFKAIDVRPEFGDPRCKISPDLSCLVVPVASSQEESPRLNLLPISTEGSLSEGRVIRFPALAKICTIAFSPEGRRLAVLGIERDTKNLNLSVLTVKDGTCEPELCLSAYPGTEPGTVLFGSTSTIFFSHHTSNSTSDVRPEATYVEELIIGGRAKGLEMSLVDAQTMDTLFGGNAPSSAGFRPTGRLHLQDADLKIDLQLQPSSALLSHNEKLLLISADSGAVKLCKRTEFGYWDDQLLPFTLPRSAGSEFSPDDSQVVIFGHEDVLVLKTNDGSVAFAKNYANYTQRSALDRAYGGTGVVKDAVASSLFSADGKWLAVVLDSGRVEYFNLAELKDSKEGAEPDSVARLRRSSRLSRAVRHPNGTHALLSNIEGYVVCAQLFSMANGVARPELSELWRTYNLGLLHHGRGLAGFNSQGDLLAINRSVYHFSLAEKPGDNSLQYSLSSELLPHNSPRAIFSPDSDTVLCATSAVNTHRLELLSLRAKDRFARTAVVASIDFPSPLVSAWFSEEGSLLTVVTKDGMLREFW